MWSLLMWNSGTEIQEPHNPHIDSFTKSIYNEEFELKKLLFFLNNCFLFHFIATKVEV